MKVRVLERDRNSARFILEGASAAFANALRRIMIAEVPCMSIFEIAVEENTSVMDDEIIAHRLGLIPLTTDLERYVLPEKCECKSEEGCERCRATFSLEAEAEEGLTAVHSGDLVPGDPRVRPVSDSIPILKLAPGQRIKLRAYARLGVGKEHARWQAVSACAYKYMPKLTVKADACDGCGACVNICPKGVIELEEGRATIKNLLACTLCRDCEKACKSKAIKVEWDDTIFIFTVETTRALPVDAVIEKAAEVFDDKTKGFLSALKAAG